MILNMTDAEDQGSKSVFSLPTHVPHSPGILSDLMAPLLLPSSAKASGQETRLLSYRQQGNSWDEEHRHVAELESLLGPMRWAQPREVKQLTQGHTAWSTAS